MMIHKLLVFLQSDGWLATVKLILKFCMERLFWHSKTFFLKNDHPEYADLTLPPGYEMRVFKAAEELQAVDFPRLKLLHCSDYFTRGSRFYVVFFQTTPVAFDRALQRI